ncbi:MAG: dihydropteroate synthase [Lawsonibacter sp.]|nr:dihydropteroate synthase [Lawsonibacter sp.]MCI8990366.1 dihydropteroate synthase [Lawsonibacter sp.]MCI9269089.1 dihydropteroate synthase [Lawsonibacter sp.]
MEFRELLNTPGPILLDGGMGTMLQARGLKLGEHPELAALEHSGWLLDIHRAYVDAGTQILCANTFGANREKLLRTGRTAEEVIPASIAIAREAAQGKALVALDLGPIGQLLEPTGTLEFETAVDIFAQQVRAAVSAGADLVMIETMTDLQECRAALLAVKENSSLPVIVSLTYEERGRTFLGHAPACAALTLEGMGADAIGINCSLGPREMPALVEELTRWTTLPISIKPNAGLPDPGGAGYDITADQFAAAMAGLTELGVKFYGGCCGTTPEYIAKLKAALAGRTIRDIPRNIPAAVCSPVQAVVIDRVRVIGERINPTGKKRMKEALLREDIDYMLGQALEQTQAGADILDVNVGLPEIDEAAMMVKVVKALQGVTDAPLQLDSTRPEVLERALRVYCGKAIINSVNGDEEVLEAILPLAKKYGAAVVGLTLDKKGIPKTALDRLDIARKIMNRAMNYGIRKEDVYIDCLTLTVSAEQAAASQTLEALSRVKKELGLKTVLGVSNISFGLPARPLVNQNFLMMAMTRGLDLPILNPNLAPMMAAVRCYHLLMNIDTDARDYIAAYGSATVSTTVTAGAAQAAAPSGGERTLEQIVIAGLKGEAGPAARKLLETAAPMEVVDGVLIPALDQVGADFEAGKVFLPQLIQAAGAAQAAFEVIREHLSARPGREEEPKGTIVLATVKGDIHDIGKNIVKVLLENYGYPVVDLGRDVEPSAVVEAAKKHSAPLVGLSALMTTTLGSMEETIRLLRAEETPCKVVVGGAVLTPDYAKRIGADFYAKDAKESVDVARQVIG